MIQNIVAEKNQECTIDLYQSGQNLMDRCLGYDIVFLDIEMPDIDGIEVGKYICAKNPACRIIIASGKVERFKDAFRVKALRFVTKPFVAEEIAEAIEVSDVIVQNEPTIAVYLARNKYEIAQKDIEMITAYNGYTEYIVGENRFRKECALHIIEQELDERRFVRINRQNIVNLGYIENFKGNQLMFRNEMYQISRRQMKLFQKRLVEFDFM